MKKHNETYIISAFPGCGKSYCYKNYQDKFTILDSDSSEFSWVKDENGNNTKERNPEFPINYINHIKENIGKADIIFVSSHDIVRKALYDNGIKTIIVYPVKNMKDDFIERYKQRGNDEGFIKFISNNFDKFIDDIDNEDYGFLKEKLHEDKKFIHEEALSVLFNDSDVGKLCRQWNNN